MTGQSRDDRSNDAAMRDQQGVGNSAGVWRPERDHLINAATDAIGECGTALTARIGVTRREAVRVPARVVIGIALANLPGGKPFKKPEMYFREIVQYRKPRRIARDDARALGRANQRAREHVIETQRTVPLRDRIACGAHLRPA